MNLKIHNLTKQQDQKAAKKLKVKVYYHNLDFSKMAIQSKICSLKLTVVRYLTRTLTS